MLFTDSAATSPGGRMSAKSQLQFKLWVRRTREQYPGMTPDLLLWTAYLTGQVDALEEEIQTKQQKGIAPHAR